MIERIISISPYAFSIYETEHAEVKSRMLEIAADVLGTVAAEWVRELLDQTGEELLYPLS